MGTGQFPTADRNAQKYHDYILLRDRLIPFAVKKANAECGPGRGATGPEEWAERWNGVYSREMERLARAEGIVG